MIGGIGGKTNHRKGEVKEGSRKAVGRESEGSRKAVGRESEGSRKRVGRQSEGSRKRVGRQSEGSRKARKNEQRWKVARKKRKYDGNNCERRTGDRN